MARKFPLREELTSKDIRAIGNIVSALAFLVITVVRHCRYPSNPFKKLEARRLSDDVVELLVGKAEEEDEDDEEDA